MRAPGTIRFAATTEDDTLDVALAVSDVTASRPAGDPRARAGAAAGPALGAGRVFLQMRGAWTVRGRVGGRPLSFTAPGAAETFVAH